MIPDILEHCKTVEDWESRRKALLELFEKIEYGKRPNVEYSVTWTECTREEVEELAAVHIKTMLKVTTNLGTYEFPLTTFIPQKRDKSVPCILLICSQNKDEVPKGMPKQLEGKSKEEIAAIMQKMFESLCVKFREEEKEAAADIMNQAQSQPVSLLDLDNDYENGHWPVKKMMEKGIAVSGFYASDAELDSAQAFPSGLAKIFGTTSERKEEEWGVLAVWAFAAKCAAEYVKTLSEVDEKRIGVTGHSRCGKAALLAGAKYQDFCAVFPNDSGCCGAAITRGKYGENLASIQAFFPHWFAPAYKKYIGKEEELPFDQHMLLGLVAPRLLHVGSGSLDAWADPKGEHRSVVLAGKVWELYGAEPFSEEMPSADTQVLKGKLGYHLRYGEHKLDTYDWMCYAQHLSEV